MKKLSVVLAMLVCISVFAQKQTIDVKKSTVAWLGKKIGGQHNGHISLMSGTVEVQGNKVVKGAFVIDMTSITCEDLTNETYNQKLVGHLKSDDFFGTEKYPMASFSVTESTEFMEGRATLTGKLIIKGHTEVISFDIHQDQESEESKVAYTAKIEVDRSKFDVKYGSSSFFDNLGDKAIEDIFTLDVALMMK